MNNDNRNGRNTAMQHDEHTPIPEETLPITQPEYHDGLDLPAHRKSKKKFRFLLASLVFVVLIAGAITYFLMSQKVISPIVTFDTSKNQPSAQPVTKKMTAKELVALSKQVVKGSVQETTSTPGVDAYNVFRAPVYKVPGYDFSVFPTVDVGFGSYGVKGIIASDLTAIQKVLTDNALIGTILDPGSAEGMYAANYESDDIICTITDQKPFGQPATSSEYNTILGCADKSAYLANAVTLKPYFVVYAAQSTFDTTQTTMGSLTIKKSATAGYSTATVSIGGSAYSSVGGFAGLFYTTPDKVLHYFTGTQSVLQCSMYESVAIKKAYFGDQCYDSNDVASTVKL